MNKKVSLFIVSAMLVLSIKINCFADESLVSEIFVKRHSGKNYDQDQVIDGAQLEALIQSARWACSSYNDQPWNYIILDRALTPEAYEKALGTILGNQRSWVEKAPILMIVIARTTLLYNDKPNEWAEYDTGAATISMALQAAELGLMTHQIGGFDKKALIEAFELPSNAKPLALMSIGYELNESEKEPKKRTRRPIEENFFLGEWGRPVVE